MTSAPPGDEHPGPEGSDEALFIPDGNSFLPTDLARALLVTAGVNPDAIAGVAWGSYAATVFTSGIVSVASALCILWLSIAWGYSRGAALFAATAYAVAGPAWCYATLFMGHALSAGCLMVAFAAAVALGGAAQSRIAPLAWIVGLFCGWAVINRRRL